jgi:hypothetical protein
MQPIDWYFMWTTGNFTVSITLDLDWHHSYLVTGGLVQTDGGDYAHAYISELCSYSGGDQVLCGIRDDGDDSGLNLYEFVSGASSVTITLHTTGGRHRAEGSIFQL